MVGKFNLLLDGFESKADEEFMASMVTMDLSQVNDGLILVAAH